MKKMYYHVVKEAVEYAKGEYGIHAGNFVNAVLRKYLREQSRYPHSEPSIIGDFLRTTDYLITRNPKPVTRNFSIAYSFPQWLVQRWLDRFGRDQCEELLHTMNIPPDFGIRVNLRNITRDEATKWLEGKGIKSRKGTFIESALYTDSLASVIKDGLFEQEFLAVQDESSQLAGFAVQPRDGDYILDACAGLGTKTRQIRECARRAFIVAADIGMKRLRQVPKDSHPVRADIMRNPFKENIFDSILLDAPCSSLGIIRKHPEIKWRRKEKDIGAFGNYQLDLLRALWNNLKTGGVMVYSVCSFEPEETVRVIERFKEERKFVLENPLPFLFNKEYFLSLPHQTGMDGYFIAKLRKL